jgi:hypothetical protein
MTVRRIVGAATATAVATGAALLLAPTAQAGTTVKAQLALSGVVTATAPAGGSVVGVHPGDAVSFEAATVPTAGLDALGVGSLLGGVLSPITGYQVTLIPGTGFPGSHTPVVLGYGAKASYALTFPTKGTFNFSWTATSLKPLALVRAPLDGNQLAQAGIKLNAKGEWVGQVVVADNPPAGGISVQLPGVSASPRLPVVGQLPGVGLPGVITPTLPGLGGLTGLLPGGSGAPTPGGGTPTPSHSATDPALNYRPPGQSLGDLVVPHGYGGGNGAASNYVPPGLSNAIVAPGTNFVTGQPGTSAKPSTATGAHSKTVDIASTKPRSALDALPTLLVVLAVIALSGATTFYARTFLLHKLPSPQAPATAA